MISIVRPGTVASLLFWVPGKDDEESRRLVLDTFISALAKDIEFDPIPGFRKCLLSGCLPPSMMIVDLSEQVSENLMAIIPAGWYLWHRCDSRMQN